MSPIIQQTWDIPRRLPRISARAKGKDAQVWDMQRTAGETDLPAAQNNSGRVICSTLGIQLQEFTIIKNGTGPTL